MERVAKEKTKLFIEITMKYEVLANPGTVFPNESHLQ